MEIWKDIEGYPNYKISSLGRLKSIKFKNHRFITGAFDKDGYIRIGLSNNSGIKYTRLHRLVAEAFIENKENKPFVNHKNGIKDDNRLDNLEWVTASENTRHAYSTGLHSQLGERNACSKLTKEQVLEIKRLYRDTNITHKEIAEKFGLHPEYPHLIKDGRRWGWLKLED